MEPPLAATAAIALSKARRVRIFDGLRHNSGVFLRLRHPQEPVSAALRARAFADGAPIDKNPAWTAVYSGFEVQIDDTARGDVSKDFYGRHPEPDGLWKNRTGAIYKTPAGDFPVDIEVWRIYMAHVQRELKARGLPPLTRD